MPTNNFELIRKLLRFDSSDDFYFLQILRRRKDLTGREREEMKNNNHLIRSYRIKSEEELMKLESEIIKLCLLFNARAGIDLNRRSFKSLAFHTLKKVSDQILSEDYDKVHSAYDSVCGTHISETDKRWILDVDEVGRATNDIILFAERECKPEGDKFVGIIPSKNGYHIIMKPFNLLTFHKKFPDIEVHKRNPTNLYIP